MSQKDFTPKERQVQIQILAGNPCIFSAGAANNPADERVVFPLHSVCKPAPSSTPGFSTSQFSKKKSLTCEDLPGYETWAEGKNIGVLIWVSGAGNKARIRPRGCGQKHRQSKERESERQQITKRKNFFPSPTKEEQARYPRLQCCVPPPILLNPDSSPTAEQV